MTFYAVHLVWMPLVAVGAAVLGLVSYVVYLLMEVFREQVEPSTRFTRTKRRRGIRDRISYTWSEYRGER